MGKEEERESSQATTFFARFTSTTFWACRRLLPPIEKSENFSFNFCFADFAKVSVTKKIFRTIKEKIKKQFFFHFSRNFHLFICQLRLVNCLFIPFFLLASWTFRHSFSHFRQSIPRQAPPLSWIERIFTENKNGKFHHEFYSFSPHCVCRFFVC